MKIRMAGGVNKERMAGKRRRNMQNSSIQNDTG